MSDDDDDNSSVYSVHSVHSVSSTNSYNNKPTRDIKRKKTPTVRPFNLPANANNVVVAMVVEESLLVDGFDEALNKEFLDKHDFVTGPAGISAASSSNSSSNNQTGGKSDGNSSGTNPKKYTYISLTTPLPGLIHWMKCDHFNQLQRLIQISCSHNQSDDNSIPFGFEAYNNYAPFFEHITMIVVPSEEFCNRILPTDEQFTINNFQNEFPKLDEWVNKVITKLSQQQQAPAPGRDAYHPRLVFAFVDLDKPCLKIQRKLNKDGRPVALQERIDQALIHLTLAHDIEIFRCKKLNELCEHLHNMTRVLETNIEKANITSFDCVMKASKQKVPEGLNAEARRIFDLQQTWGAMLQMVPLLSKEKAIAFIQNPEYSCVKRVYTALNDSNEPEKKRMALVQNEFGKTKSGAVRNETKLAKHVYKLMTVTDPEACLQDD